MFPQMASVLRGWTKRSQMRVVTQVPVDFEVLEKVDAIVWFDVLLTPMSPQKIQRKPENLRTWKWWEAFTTQDIITDTVMQDFEGTQYRMDDKYNWNQAGFYKYDFVEQPPQAPAKPAAPESQQ